MSYELRARVAGGERERERERERDDRPRERERRCAYCVSRLV